MMTCGHVIRYLKNLILGYIEGGHDRTMLPVIGEMLGFSPAEASRVMAKKSWLFG